MDDTLRHNSITCNVIHNSSEQSHSHCRVKTSNQRSQMFHANMLISCPYRTSSPMIQQCNYPITTTETEHCVQLCFVSCPTQHNTSFQRRVFPGNWLHWFDNQNWVTKTRDGTVAGSRWPLCAILDVWRKHTTRWSWGTPSSTYTLTSVKL